LVNDLVPDVLDGFLGDSVLLRDLLNSDAADLRVVGELGQAELDDAT
jgi:hypothetical protein